MAISNIYDASQRIAENLFRPYVEGSFLSLFLVVSEKRLSDEAREACLKTAERLGYPSDSVAFALIASDEGEKAPGPHGDSDGVPLDSKSLLALVEGIDPLVAFCTDKTASDLLLSAYGLPPFDEDGFHRVRGRSVVALGSFESSLGTPEGKRRSWALLKNLGA